MTMILKPTALADAHQSRPAKSSAPSRALRRLLVALVAAPVFCGFGAQLVMLARLLGACA